MLAVIRTVPITIQFDWSILLMVGIHGDWCYHLVIKVMMMPATVRPKTRPSTTLHQANFGKESSFLLPDYNFVGEWRIVKKLICNINRKIIMFLIAA